MSRMHYLFYVILITNIAFEIFADPIPGENPKREIKRTVLKNEMKPIVAAGAIKADRSETNKDDSTKESTDYSTETNKDDSTEAYKDYSTDEDNYARAESIEDDSTDLEINQTTLNRNKNYEERNNSKTEVAAAFIVDYHYTDDEILSIIDKHYSIDDDKYARTESIEDDSTDREINQTTLDRNKKDEERNFIKAKVAVGFSGDKDEKDNEILSTIDNKGVTEENDYKEVLLDFGNDYYYSGDTRYKESNENVIAIVGP